MIYRKEKYENSRYRVRNGWIFVLKKEPKKCLKNLFKKIFFSKIYVPHVKKCGQKIIIRSLSHHTRMNYFFSLSWEHVQKKFIKNSTRDYKKKVWILLIVQKPRVISLPSPKKLSASQNLISYYHFLIQKPFFSLQNEHFNKTLKSSAIGIQMTIFFFISSSLTSSLPFYLEK